MNDKRKIQNKLDVLEPDVTRGLLSRLRLTHLLQVFPERPLWAVFMFVNGFITIGLLAVVAMVSGTPFVFPSLGPTAILLFMTPLSPTASPRNTLIGHAVGIGCGYGALLVTGLSEAPPALVAGIDHRRIIAAALSLALTSGILVLLKAAHPPAGATTLIVSLGFVTRSSYLMVVEIAVAVLVLQAMLINRAAGLEYPLWAKRVQQVPPERG